MAEGKTNDDLLGWPHEGSEKKAPDLLKEYGEADETAKSAMYSALHDKYNHLSGQVAGLADAILALDLRGSEDEGACGIAAIRLNSLVSDLKATTAERDKLKAKPAAPAKRVQAVKLRKAAPIVRKDDDDAFDPEALLAKIREADEIEVVVSDGKSEISGIPAISLDGDQPWQVSGPTLQLVTPELIIEGPQVNGGSVEIDGYGLLLDGKLAAYGKRMEPLRINTGQRFNLANDVVFAG